MRLRTDSAPADPMTGTVTELHPTISVDDTRLVWAPKETSHTFDGAWWPMSRDAPAELIALVPHASRQLGGAVTRVSLNIDAWDADQPRRLTVGNTLVRLGWFHTLDAATITLARGSFDRITLLVIPRDYDDASAGALMQHLSDATTWPDDVTMALSGR